MNVGNGFTRLFHYLLNMYCTLIYRTRIILVVRELIRNAEPQFFQNLSGFLGLGKTLLGQIYIMPAGKAVSCDRGTLDRRISSGLSVAGGRHFD